MFLSVVIVSYNVKYYLEQCLRSVFAASKDLEMEVFVVDNHSTDGTLEYLTPLFPQVRFIENDENVGFSRANNQAIREAKGRYILLLNPDTFVTEHTFRDCMQYLDQHPEVGATGCAMYGWDGRFAWESRRGVPTPWTSFCKMVGLTCLFPHSRRFGRYYMRYLNREEANYIDIISGAFFMLRREALDQVGLLDETFFMYGEDIDLSYRLLQAGWRNAYVPTPILHYKGESTQKTTFRYVHIFYQAMLLFFDKHFRRRRPVLALLVRLAVLLRAGLDVMKQTYHKVTAHLTAPFHRSPQPETALCIGNGHSLDAMRELCKRGGLVCTTLTVGEAFPMDLTPFTYVVFDTSQFSYSDIVRSLTQTAQEGRTTALGTYHPQSQIMILPNDVLR